MKRKIRNISFILCLLFCLIPLNSCKESGGEETKTSESESESKQELPPGESPGQPEDPTQMEPRTYSFAEIADRVKLIGRGGLTDDGAAVCDFTASGFELKLNMVGKLTMITDASAQTYFTVFIDGIRQTKRFSVQEGRNVQLELAFFEEPGEHSIRVLKQTDAQNSLCKIKSLTFQGILLEKPAERELFIEFIGDGIFCGLGNVNCDNGTPEADVAKYQDGTLAYPFLTAEALNADYSVVGFNGMGVTVGAIDSNVTDVYIKQSYLRDSEKDYDFSKAPNLVVINLGTNDALFRDKTTKEEFKATVKNLIRMIRELNGKDIPIVWAYNSINDGCLEWIREAINEMGGKLNWLYLCELNRNVDGGNGHPTAETHQISSEQLIAFIRENGLLELTGEIPPVPVWENDLPVIWV